MNSVGVDKHAPWKPEPGTKFLRRDVEKVIGEIVTGYVGDKPYVSSEAMAMSREMATQIQDRVASMKYIRYKVVVQVFVTENCNQGMRIASRCLWDPENDGFAEFNHSTKHMHVTALVFGLYWE